VLGWILYSWGKLLSVITCDKSKKTGISIKSEGGWRVKSKNLEKFLLLLP
jgi:hypothetical protein